MLLQITLTLLLTLAYVVATPPPGYEKKEEATSDKDVPKYKYGYKISDEKGSQEKQEQRDGIYAHGRYNVHGQDSHQSVEYLADDWGFHPFIEYSNTSPHSKSSTIIALGEEAVKALRSNQKTTPSSDQPGTQQSNVVYVTQPQFQTTQQVYINNELPTTPAQQSVAFTVPPTQQQQQNLIYVTNPAPGSNPADKNSEYQQQNSHSIKINHPPTKTEAQKDDDVKSNIVYTTPQTFNQNENVLLVTQPQDNVIYINHPHPTQKIVVINQDQKSQNQNVQIENTHQQNAILQDTHANLALPNHGGNQIYQHTSAQLVQVSHNGENKQQSQAEQLFQGVAQLENQVAQFAQKVAQQNPNHYKQTENHFIEQANNYDNKNEANNESNQSQSSNHHAHEISQAYKTKTTSDYSQISSNEEDPYPYSGDFGTKINPKFNHHHVEQNYQNSKLIENTKNLISGQDVLNINDVLNQNLGEHVEVTTSSYDDSSVSTTLAPKQVSTEKNEISLLKEPIVVAELDENNINEEEKESYFSTTRSTLETSNTASGFQSTPTIVVTPRPVGTTFLAPITAGVQLEQAGEVKEEKPKVKTSVLVDIQKSVPYYIGRFEYVPGPNGYVSKQVDKQPNSTIQTEEFGQQLLQYTLEAIPTPEGIVQQEKSKVSPTVQTVIQQESSSEALSDHQAFNEHVQNQQNIVQDSTQQQVIEQALAQHQKNNQAIEHALLQHQSDEQQKQSIQNQIQTHEELSENQQRQIETEKIHQQQFEKSVTATHQQQKEFEASLAKLQQEAVSTALEQQKQFEASLAKSHQQALHSVLEQQQQFELSLAKTQQQTLEQHLGTSQQQQSIHTAPTPQVFIQQSPTPHTLVFTQQQEVLTTPQIYIQQLPQLSQQSQIIIQQQDASGNVVHKTQTQKVSEDQKHELQQILKQQEQENENKEQQTVIKTENKNQQHHLRQILLQNHREAQQEQQQREIILQQQNSAQNQILLVPTPQPQNPHQYLIEPLPTPHVDHKQFLIEPLPTPQSLIQHQTSEENKIQTINDQKTKNGHVDYQLIPQHGKQEGNLVSHYSQNVVHTHSGQKHNHGSAGEQQQAAVSFQTFQSQIGNAQATQHVNTQNAYVQAVNLQREEAARAHAQAENVRNQIHSNIQYQNQGSKQVDQLANAYAQAVKHQYQTETANNQNQYNLNLQETQSVNTNNKVKVVNQQDTQASTIHTDQVQNLQGNVEQKLVIHQQNNHQIQEDQNVINEFYQHLQQLTPHLTNDGRKTDIKYQLPVPQHIYLVPPQVQEAKYPQDSVLTFDSQKLATVTHNVNHQQLVNQNQQDVQNSIKSQHQEVQNQFKIQNSNQQDAKESISHQQIQESNQNQIRQQQEIRNQQREVQNAIRHQAQEIQNANRNYQHAHNAVKAAQAIHNSIRDYQEYQQQLAAGNHEAQKLVQQKQEAQDLQIESSQEVHSNVQNIHAGKERVVEIVKAYPVKVPYPVEKIVRQPYPVEVKVPVEVPVEKVVEKKVPVPVEVKVPVPQPYVVEVPKPYPVQVTKLVPQPYPVTVTKTVKVPVPTPYEIKVPHPVPVEVPKYIERPYPIYVSQETQQQLGYAPNYQINCDHKEESYVPTGSNFYHTIHLNDYIGLTPPKSTNKPSSAYQTISASQNIPKYHQSNKQVVQKQNTKPQPQAHSTPYITYTISQQNQHQATAHAQTTKNSHVQNTNQNSHVQNTIQNSHVQNTNQNYNYGRKYRNARQGFDNLRIEYGFMPPLIPSLEIDENGKPVEKPDDN